MHARRHTPPEPLKFDQQPGTAARGLLDDEVAVERQPLDTGDRAVLLVQMRPARLRHADVRTRQHGRDDAAQKVGMRPEVGIEDRNELSAALGQAPSQRPGFEAAPIRPMEHAHVHAAGAMPGRARLGQCGRLVGGIVQNLNLQPVGRIIQRGRGVNQPLDDMLLVEDRQLHRDVRPLSVFYLHRRSRVMPVTQVKHGE